MYEIQKLCSVNNIDKIEKPYDLNKLNKMDEFANLKLGKTKR